MAQGQAATDKCATLAKAIIDERAQSRQERAALEARCSVAERVYQNIEQGRVDADHAQAVRSPLRIEGPHELQARWSTDRNVLRAKHKTGKTPTSRDH